MMESRITIVTAYFRINRTNWSGFERSDEEYFNHFMVWARLHNRIIVYVETEELRQNILLFRKEIGQEANTEVVLVHDCVSLEPELYKRFVNSTENKIQQLYRLQKTNPESWNPTYNYIMLMKSKCVCDAISRKLADGMVAWVDFGYNHGGFPIEASSDFNFEWKYDFPEKMNLFLIQDLDDRPIFDIVMNMDTYIMGGVIVGKDNLWGRFWELLRKSFEELSSCGLSDDDQSIMLMAYRKQPELFALHKSYWSIQMKQFGGNHLTWAPAFIRTRKNSILNRVKNSIGRVRYGLLCARYALGIYKYLKTRSIH